MHYASFALSLAAVLAFTFPTAEADPNCLTNRVPGLSGFPIFSQTGDIYHKCDARYCSYSVANASAGKCYLTFKSNGPGHESQIRIKNDSGGDCWVVARNQAGTTSVYNYVKPGASQQCDMAVSWGGWEHYTVESYCVTE